MADYNGFNNHWPAQPNGNHPPFTHNYGNFPAVMMNHHLAQSTSSGEEYIPAGFENTSSSGYVPTDYVHAHKHQEDPRSTDSPVSRLYNTNWEEYDSYRCGTPDLEELRFAVEDAKQKQRVDRKRAKQDAGKPQPLAQFIATLREADTEAVRDGNDSPKQPRDRIVLDRTGKIVSGPKRKPSGRTRVLSLALELQRAAAGMNDIELPPGPPYPTEPEEIRRVVRGKMPRCKVCRNRFGERNLLERHLRDNHRTEYLEYIAQQEEEIQLQKLEEQEMNRIEELQSGGFIPPEDGFDPTAGSPMTEERKAELRALRARRPFRKKVSPQCNFCDKRFRNEVSLKKHLVKKHTECCEFVQCLDCFKCLPSAEDLPEHDCDLTFICFECTPMRNLCSAQRLLLHRAKFHRGANSGFRCNECNLKFLTPRKLRKHKKMAHVFTKTYSCHFCEELFTSEISVVTHERMHTGIIKFECLICDFRCNRYTEMEAHKKEEHGYICSICRQPFAEWSEIKDHTLREHGGYLTNESSTGYVESPRVWVIYKGE